MGTLRPLRRTAVPQTNAPIYLWVTIKTGVLFFIVTQHPGLAEMAKRLMGSMSVLVLAVVGAVMMVVRHPRLWLLVPLAGLGAFSALGGMCFGI